VVSIDHEYDCEGPTLPAGSFALTS